MLENFQKHVGKKKYKKNVIVKQIEKEKSEKYKRKLFINRKVSKKKYFCIFHLIARRALQETEVFLL